jgi:hypothetical protein
MDFRLFKMDPPAKRAPLKHRAANGPDLWILPGSWAEYEGYPLKAQKEKRRQSGSFRTGWVAEHKEWHGKFEVVLRQETDVGKGPAASTPASEHFTLIGRFFSHWRPAASPLLQEAFDALCVRRSLGTIAMGET